MTPAEALTAFHSETEAIMRLKDYSQRYTECKKLRKRWNDADMLPTLLQSDFHDKINFGQMLPILLEYMMKNDFKLKQVEASIHNSVDRSFTVSAIWNMSVFCEKRNDAAALGMAMGSFQLAYDVATIGEELTPHMMKALNYYRKNRLLVAIVIEAFMTTVYDVLCNYSCMADPRATPLMQAYKQFRNEPQCRIVVVACMLKYPSDSREVRALMKQIAYNDPDLKVRHMAKYFFQKD